MILQRFPTLDGVLKVNSPLLSSLPEQLNVTFEKCGKGYSVKKNGNEAVVCYSSLPTLYRAIALLAALAHEDSVTTECGDNIGVLGIMLDCSRNAVPHMEFLRDFALNIAHLGYNTLYLYTEDTYRIPGEPYFGHLRGGYTGEQLKGFDNYCASLGIELVPCIQTLAHLNQIFRWPEYSDINDCADILLLSNEKSYELIEKMAQFCRSSFASAKVNIGLDEAHLLGLGKYLHQNGFVDRVELIKKHILRVSEIFSRHGFTEILMWSDMFIRLVSKGEYYDDTGSVPENLKGIVPDNITLVYWDYYTLDKEKYMAMFKKHKQLGGKLYFASGAWKWKGFTPSNLHSIKAARLGIGSAKESGVSNVFVTAWGDNGAECGIMAVMPSFIDASNVYYGSSDKYADGLCKVLTGVSFEGYLSLDRADRLNAEFDSGTLTNNTKFLLYSDLLQGMFDACVRKSYNDAYRENSEQLKKYTHTKYGYVFKTLACLTELLSVKSALGLSISEHYHAADKRGLKEDIKSIKRCIALAHDFYNALKQQWLAENGPFGREIQDARIGGMIFRMQQNIITLEDFIAGKTQAIPELEEKRLNPFIKSGEDNRYAEDAVFNSYSSNISANIL